MKLPKILLGAVAICAIAGSVLAFKVRTSSTIYTHAVGDPANKCTVPLNKWIITEDPAPVFTAATFNSLQACAPTFITTTAD